MQRGLIAVFVGLLVMMVVWLALILVWLAVGLQVAPDQFALPKEGEQPQAPTDFSWLMATVVIDSIAAASCGLVVVRIAGPRQGRSHATVAAIVLVLACLFQLFFDAGALPRWVPLLRVLFAPTSLVLAANWMLGRYVHSADAGKMPGASSASQGTEKDAAAADVAADADASNGDETPRNSTDAS